MQYLRLGHDKIFMSLIIMIYDLRKNSYMRNYKYLEIPIRNIISEMHGVSSPPIYSNSIGVLFNGLLLELPIILDSILQPGCLGYHCFL